LGVSSCATIGSFSSGFADYRAYLEPRVKTERLYDRGKQLFAAKALFADSGLHDEQEKAAPGFGFRLDPTRAQVVLAVSSFGRRSASSLDFQARLGGQAPVRVEEVQPALVERLYPFAHPFYRVFLMDFDRAGSPGESRELEVRSPWGRLRFAWEEGA
jgi:hypothetical protein